MSLMIKSIADIEHFIKNEKTRLFSHSLYPCLHDLEALKCFMSYHVFAVWDFMNLLTYLQSVYTCTSIPWRPPKQPKLARLINEIKLGEESDSIHGQVTSHFDFYVQAMNSLKINVNPIHYVIAKITTMPYKALITDPQIPTCIQSFLDQTYTAIHTNSVCVAASFAFGRETIIPTMFLRIIEKTNAWPESDSFKHYLDRHIELDGEEHGDLSLQLVSEICGTNAVLWQQAAEAAQSAIKARITLYTDIETAIRNPRVRVLSTG